MEKRRPHFPLPQVIQLASRPEKVRFTRVARQGADDLHMTATDVLGVIVSLTMHDFYKSMTTYAEHTTWQDVYRPAFQGIPLYLKLTVIPEEQLPARVVKEEIRS